MEGGGWGVLLTLGRKSSEKEVTAHNLGSVLLTFLVFRSIPPGGREGGGVVVVGGGSANRPTSESESIVPTGGILSALNPTFSCNLTLKQRELLIPSSRCFRRGSSQTGKTGLGTSTCEKFCFYELLKRSLKDRLNF